MKTEYNHLRVKIYDIFITTIWLVTFFHLAYFVLFYIIFIPKLIIVEIFSLFIYAFIITIIKKNPHSLKIASYVFQVEVTLHTIICIYTLGFGAGFELLFLAFVLVNLFISIGYASITKSLTFLQVVLFILCYYIIPDTDILSSFWTKFLYVYHIIFICILAIIISYMLELANRLAYLNIQQDRDKLKDISEQDPLTKLSNRHALQNFISENLVNKNFALIIADIDDFKSVNDTFGHSVGDMVLVRIANMLKNIFRHEDFVCRWGGEEFLIIIHDVDKNSAVNIVKRVSHMLNTTSFKHNENIIKTTMTFGISYYDGYSELDLQKMIKHADDLLYKGKTTGKNKIMLD
ncbi:GGDEF domain-containing protein [Campylobacter majalis]|uniref:GGDEF domain-containing protein n=1 Tax=Campylobacter majalis TaxID=2790656 RepID=UPI003D69A523